MFTTTKLAGDRVLVAGADVTGTTGTQILDALQWNSLKATQDHMDAHASYDAAVEAFYAPLNAATDALKATAKPKTDPLFYVVAQEGSEAIEGTAEILIHLDHDSAVLRLIEQDPENPRLLWVEGNLEILDASEAPEAVAEALAPIDFTAQGDADLA